MVIQKRAKMKQISDKIFLTSDGGFPLIHKGFQHTPRRGDRGPLMHSNTDDTDHQVSEDYIYPRTREGLAAAKKKASSWVDDLISQHNTKIAQLNARRDAFITKHNKV